MIAIRSSRVAALLPEPGARFLVDVDLDAVVAALAPRLLAYALARTGCLHTAEDIAQEALAALVRRWRRDGTPESPDAFVFAIAKRRAGRAIFRRALMVPLDVLRGASRDVANVEQDYERRAELKTVLSAIRRLPRMDREALLLRLTGELQIHEIAAMTHATPAAVKMRIHRARRRLKALLPEHTHGRRTRTA